LASRSFSKPRQATLSVTKTMKNKAVINYPLITRNSKGNIVHCKFPNEFESWLEYNEKNQLAHYRDSKGVKVWYDSKGNEIPNPPPVIKDTSGEIKPVINYPLKTTDSKGNTVHCKRSDKFECWFEYDEKNELAYYGDSNGLKIWYDSKGNVVHSKNSDMYECWNEFHEDGYRIRHWDSRGHKYWYDSKGNEISNPDLVIEVTLEEIAEKFKISAKSLRIKK